MKIGAVLDIKKIKPVTRHWKWKLAPAQYVITCMCSTCNMYTRHTCVRAKKKLGHFFYTSY